jgi:hypothetical protein
VKPPFAVVNRNGVTWVDRSVDEAFRKALMDGVPPQLRGKMQEALSAIPNERSKAHAERYFGAELPAIKNQIAPLIIELNKVLGERFNLPGLFDWLEITGYGNEYRMIKAFHAWSEFILSVAKTGSKRPVKADG